MARDPIVELFYSINAHVFFNILSILKALFIAAATPQIHNIRLLCILLAAAVSLHFDSPLSLRLYPLPPRLVSNDTREPNDDEASTDAAADDIVVVACHSHTVPEGVLWPVWICHIQDESEELDSADNEGDNNSQHRQNDRVVQKCYWVFGALIGSVCFSSQFPLVSARK